MRATVISTSSELVDPNYISNMESFSGKMAGICYMKDTYFNSYVSDSSKSKDRFDRVISTGHHSISDHCFITVLFEDMPKMTAMILNSIGFYNTSEKSGRYTIMKSDGVNKKLYDKWFEIFFKLIADNDPLMDSITGSETLRKKLAQENARYMLSMFDNAVTMGYTTSLRMWSYVVCWCRDYLETAKQHTHFDKKVWKCVNDLYLILIANKCYSDKIVDNKGRKFNFLAKQVQFPIWDANTSYGDSYLLKYKTSFANLAQEQRHRTLDYYMVFDGSTPLEFYTPKLLTLADNKQYATMWREDLISIADSFPIATLVDVVETGFITNFLMKCDERLCGRTMLETMENVRNNLYRFMRHWNKSPFMIEQLKRHMRDGNVIMKCGNIKCQEPCRWGPRLAQTRNI